VNCGLIRFDGSSVFSLLGLRLVVGEREGYRNSG
jgi:hypothetical protein